MKMRHNMGNSKYFIGNGKMAACISAGEMEDIFGMPYSSPSAFTLTFEEGLDAELTISRFVRSAIWKCIISKSRKNIGSFCDFALASQPCLCRQIEASENVTFLLKRHHDLKQDFLSVINWKEYSGGSVAAFRYCLPAGNFFYSLYPITFNQYYYVLVRGAAEVETIGRGELRITAKKGKSEILIVADTSDAQCEETMKTIVASDASIHFYETQALWWNYFENKNFEKIVPKGLSQREMLLQAMESVIVLIKTQQSENGGVLAGYCYKMAYVRDQYGVFRGLLKMGCLEEAKRILLFYRDIFLTNHKIKNAQAIGINSMFHNAENDEVEITGYLVLSVKNWLDKTGDLSLALELFDMMRWAIDAQIKHLAAGMIPFNGDETYIAGGLVSRGVIDDGSAEATLLYIYASEFFVEFGEKNRLLSHGDIAYYKKYANQAKKKYPENFLIEGRFITNNPQRKNYAKLPRYRIGVCNSDIMHRSSQCARLGWVKRMENGTYLCSACRSEGLKTLVDKRIYEEKSVSLVPRYLGRSYIPEEITEQTVEQIAKDLFENGFLSTYSEPRSVGYDYGLLLYNLAHMDTPYGDYAFNKILNMADESGAWTEYYNRGIPSGTRYRPWESAINIEGLLEYAEMKYKYSPEREKYFDSKGTAQELCAMQSDC